MFYFQQLLNQGLNGIDKTAMITTVVGIGYTILVVGFLIGLYQAALRGGDVQSLAITGIKYLVIAIILGELEHSVSRGQRLLQSLRSSPYKNRTTDSAD